MVKLDSGCVRKVFTLSGSPVLKLAEFFDAEEVFFAYGNERVVSIDDFELEPEESKAIRNTKKVTKNSAMKGPKPKMPVKSHNDTFVCTEEDLLNGGIRSDSLPIDLQNRWLLDLYFLLFYYFFI